MSDDVRDVTVVVPVGAASLEIVEWSSTDPHAGVAATMQGEHGAYRDPVDQV